MRISTLLCAATLAVIAAAPALAQQGGRSLPTFEASDANKDGKVTKAEFTAALPENAKQYADRLFDARDTSPKDGALTKEEFNAGSSMGSPGAPK